MQFITPVDVTPGSIGSWVDVNVSSYVAAGATGVILHCYLNNSSEYSFGLRKNGSTDARTNYMAASSHHWCAIGIDGSGIFEAYIGRAYSQQKIYIVGYFESEATFFTNATNKSLGSTGSWTDIDISSDTGTDTAIGAFFEVVSNATTNTWGLRKNGSTDNVPCATAKHTFATIGVDGSEICEGYISSTYVDWYLNGYITDGATYNTNAVSRALGSSGSWLDLTALESGALGGIFELRGAGTNTLGLRKNGSAEAIIYTPSSSGGHSYGMVECDASQIIEGYAGHIAAVPWLVGYFSPITGGEEDIDAIFFGCNF